MLPRFSIRPCILISTAVALMGCGLAMGQTWIGPGTDWNTAANWFPAVVPNSPTANASFTGTALGTVNISASVQAQSLSFTNPTGNYTLTSSASQTLSGLTSIVVGSGVTSGVRTINLANVATGSLLYGATFTVNNQSTALGTTLVIGTNTVIGAPAHGGLTFTGVGVTQLSGSFASTNTVTGGLTKSGPGTLIFSGSGANLSGGLTVTGGTLELDYSGNPPTSKLGLGGLTLGGGLLSLVANTTTPFTQTVAGMTVNAGHTDVVARSAGGGTLTLAAGAISRSTGGTGRLRGATWPLP